MGKSVDYWNLFSSIIMYFNLVFIEECMLYTFWLWRETATQNFKTTLQPLKGEIQSRIDERLKWSPYMGNLYFIYADNPISIKGGTLCKR